MDWRSDIGYIEGGNEWLIRKRESDKLYIRGLDIVIDYIEGKMIDWLEKECYKLYIGGLDGGMT